MTTTVDISEEVLKRAMEYAHAASPEEAIKKAVDEYARRARQKDLIELMGKSDTFMTAEELDQMRSMD